MMASLLRMNAVQDEIRFDPAQVTAYTRKRRFPQHTKTATKRFMDTHLTEIHIIESSRQNLIIP